MNSKSYLRLKGCPKCGGDILVDRDIENEDSCLQCGYRKTVVATASQVLAARPKRRVAVASGRINR